MKLSNEQLTRLALHTAGINSVLAEAMLEASVRTDTGTERVETDIEVDGFRRRWRRKGNGRRDGLRSRPVGG